MRDHETPSPQSAASHDAAEFLHRAGDGFAQSADDSDGYVAGDLSLAEEVEALISDGKTFLEAELSFQKTRLAFVADIAKGAAVFGIIAAAFGALAMVGLTVGLIIALTPILTAWGASAVVVGLIILAALLAAREASKRWRKLINAIQPDNEPRT